MLLTPKDLSFVGYTYKNFDAVKGLHGSLGNSFALISIIFSHLEYSTPNQPYFKRCKEGQLKCAPSLIYFVFK